MKPFAILLPLLSAAGLLLAFFYVTGSARAIVLDSGDLVVSEMSLNPSGNAYEVSQDDSGDLWISDYTAGELWQVNAAGDAYTTYPVGGNPSDARPDTSGKIWWVDTKNGRIGRLTPDLNVMERWNLPGSSKLYGLRVETAQKIWATDAALPTLYRLDLAANQVCTYTLPDSGSSGYLTLNNGQVWSGDWVNERIYRLDPKLKQYTYWQLPTGGIPEGLIFDPSGNLWWSNFEQGILDRLDPQTGALARYSIPEGSSPEMLVWAGETLWYSERSLGTIGRLNPGEASAISETLTSQTLPVTPQCGSVQASGPTHLNPTTGSPASQTKTYPTLVSLPGWTIYQLPANALPWGITYRGGNVWVVDANRHVLVKFAINAWLTACKMEDQDGDPLTTEDQIPREGWPLDLKVNGVSQTPGKLTGPDGCATWGNLGTDASYEVQEEAVPGWMALGPTSHNFGTLAAGASYDYTFVNAQTITVTACSLTDEDGELATTEDRSPLPGQKVSLQVDGASQGPAQMTQQDGCTAWTDLAPLHSYGLEADTSGGGNFLSPSQVDFGPGAPGDSFQYDFILASGGTNLFLPMVVR